MDPRAAARGAGPDRRASPERVDPSGPRALARARPGAGPGRPYSHRYRWLAPHPEPVRGAAWRPHCRPRARPRQRRASPSAGERGAMTAHRCRPTRTLLLYAQDNQGLGHVTRALTIARHLLAAYPDTVAYIATKSPVASHFRLPERCDYIKLPTLLAPAGLARTPAEEEAAKQHFRAIRGEILRDVALGLAPDLVLVDHEPLGSKGEFRDGLCALKAARPHTRFIFGLRDIMDDAARIRATWQEMGVYEAFEQLYDGIAVYGSSRLYNVADAYAIPASVQTKLEYCGYIVRDPPAEEESGALRQRYGLPPAGPLVVATVGSGRRRDRQHGGLQQRVRGAFRVSSARDRATCHAQGGATDSRRDPCGARVGALGASHGRGARDARGGAGVGARPGPRNACAPGARRDPGVRRGRASHGV